MSELSKFLIPIAKEQSVAEVDPNKDVELTKSTASEWVKQEFVKEMPVLMESLVDAWKDMLKNGDNSLSPKAKVAQQVAEALGVLQSKSTGVTVNTQINNTNSNNTISAASRESLASIIRQLDKEKHTKRNDDVIIDAELIDPDEN